MRRAFVPLSGTLFGVMGDPNTGEIGSQQGPSPEGDPERRLPVPSGRTAGAAGPRNRRSPRIYEGWAGAPGPEGVVRAWARGATVGESATPPDTGFLA